LVLDVLESVDWARLHGAYGAAADVPDLIKTMAGRDAEGAAKARRLLEAAVYHQGTTYSASAPVVPFLAELLVTAATHHRADLAWLLGEMAAFNNQRTKHISAVRAAVTAQVDRLLPLLADADTGVREGVAFTLSQCPKRKRHSIPALRACYGAETEPQAKARILASLQRLEPASGLVAAALSAGNPAPVRAAAALILARSDLPWSAEATEAVRDGWAHGEQLEACWWWGRGSSPLEDLVAAIGKRGTECAAVLAMLLESQSAPAREAAARGAVLVVRVHRASRSALAPVLAAALTDQSAQARNLAATALHEAGAAARPAADALARSGTPRAICALIRLGDPRWPALLNDANAADVLAALSQGTRHLPVVPYNPALAAALTATMRTQATTQTQAWNAALELITVWGPDAHTAVPQLLAAYGTPKVPQALAAIGPAAAAALPLLRADVNSADALATHRPFSVSHVEQRLAILRIGNDPGPALDAARAALAKLHDRKPSNHYYHHDLPYDDAVALLDGLGEHARVLLPEIRALLGAFHDYIGLARTAQRLAVAADEITPTVRQVLELAADELRHRTRSFPGDQAAELAADTGDAAVVPLLTPLLADPTPRSRQPAARAIWQLTGSADGLIAPLLREVTSRPPGRWLAALELLAEMGPAAAGALDELREVTGHPWSPFVDKLEFTGAIGLGHTDDAFLAAGRAAIAAIQHGSSPAEHWR
jgi:hypothetical protein